MSTDANLPVHLERLGGQLVTAAHELRGADRRRRRRRAHSLVAIAAAAAALAALLITSAGTSTPPAYALTRNADGSITVTLSDLATGIPQLNARFRQMGIDETVIPVTPSCPHLGLVAGPGSMSETVTLSPGYADPGNAGFDGYLAAERLPDGRIAIGIGSGRPPLPSCFSPKALSVVPSNVPLDRNGHERARR